MSDFWDPEYRGSTDEPPDVFAVSFADEAGRPRDVSLRDVLARLEEMQLQLNRIEEMLDGGVCCYGDNY